MGYESKLTRQLYDTARRSPQRVVFAEGIHPNMLKDVYKRQDILKSVFH